MKKPTLDAGVILRAEATGKQYVIRRVDDDELEVVGVFGTFDAGQIQQDIRDGKITIIDR